MKTGFTSKRLLVFLIAASTVLFACSLFSNMTLRGSGVRKTETRQVSGFSKVTLAGIGDLSIEQAGTESLTVEADDNILPLITTDVQGDTLVIGFKGQKAPISTQIRYTLAVKDLNAITCSGLGNIHGQSLKLETLAAQISGGCNMDLSGEAPEQNLNISGLGNLNLGNLVGQTATVTISGGGSGTVNVSDTLDVTISGLGSLKYKGNPQVTKNITGGGSVQQEP